ncbi:hypothetical protein WR25_08402 [Diploscapter pachys]|uniref:Uncharacterized protein n=1 Tax=Diploscapter pachys TaxID=2018661 RepID=A0A2A2M4T1_9BILA|nr:hypothetical protein WR25_08402 [Diploscapter pachys]
MPCAVAEANGVIQPLARQIDAVVVDREAQVDVRMRRVEIVDPLDQPARREGADDADVQRVTEAPVGIAVQRRADPIERFGEYRHQGMAVIGQRKPARQPVEQPRAQPAFELRDLMTDRALADAQFESRARAIGRDPCA